MLARIFAIIMLVAVPARADTPVQEARVLVEAADRDYKLGRFEQALAEYTNAYEKYPAAPLLFNIAQCHRNLKQYERAVFFYEGFLREARKDDNNRKIVEDLLREMRAALARESADATARQHADDEAKQRAADDARRRDDDRRRAEEDARRRADEDRRVALMRQNQDTPVYRKTWFWPVVGAVVVAAGATTLLLTRKTEIVEPGAGTSLGGLDRR
jgi:tetratricopeptide (TPR) repeat protein